MSDEPEKRIKLTARVRRGLRRADMVIGADLEDRRSDYRSHGMSKADLEDYELAAQWIKQQSSVR